MNTASWFTSRKLTSENEDICWSLWCWCRDCSQSTGYCTIIRILSTSRCGEPDFGHTHLWLEDRIQSHINEIYGVDIFPGRTNVCQYKPLDFKAIGVVPLCLNEDYHQFHPQQRRSFILFEPFATTTQTRHVLT